ncbi:hypothetical protein TraAM80_05557 [Trypanosoma rangeli]|uniref:Uncharacterized protein n=1 Tax=Trypanosoma rangeli TaxID=5698 RepID=A0A3R7K9A4_TRYRA|nr:uncharacterized protein TraAM80_05557 [Trypanosoma rangeli]RNF03813.1 hypothetical protein TraAM80_05557 [Trypanosoma rangeli]|eukprot:RNF03813.1 hypothetical protein TraAM80_05557 [Trypanosoma rangeli]
MQHKRGVYALIQWTGRRPLNDVKRRANNMHPVTVSVTHHEAALQHIVAEDCLKVSKVRHAVGHRLHLVVAPEQFTGVHVEDQACHSGPAINARRTQYPRRRHRILVGWLRTNCTGVSGAQ